MYKNKRLADLDLLRFIAALSVVAFHFFYHGNSNHASPIILPDFLVSFSRYGFLGVELFFMISGFVILMSSENRTPGQFIKARFIRLYPTLWLAGTLTYLGFLFIGRSGADATFSQYLANMTLFHRMIFNQEHLDGSFWTLTVELRFYILITLLITFKKISYPNLIRLMSFWCLLGLWFLFKGKSSSFVIYGCYFSAGSAFYILYREGLSARNLLFLLLTYISCLISVYSMHGTGGLNPLVLLTTVSLFFLAFSALSSGRSLNLPPNLLFRLGALTYPLYLIHQELGYMIFNNWQPNMDGWLKCGIVMGLFVFIAYLISSLYEPWAHRIARRVLTRSVVGQPKKSKIWAYLFKG